MIKWFMDDKKLAEKEMMLTRIAKDVLNARFSCKCLTPSRVTILVVMLKLLIFVVRETHLKLFLNNCR